MAGVVTDLELFLDHTDTNTNRRPVQHIDTYVYVIASANGKRIGEPKAESPEGKHEIMGK